MFVENVKEYQLKNKFEVTFIISLVSLSLLTLSLFFISHGSQQATIIFKSGEDSFMDFFNVLKYISTRDPYHYDLYQPLCEKQYPPLSYLLLYPFTKLYNYIDNSAASAISNPNAMISFVILFAILFTIYGILLFKMKNGSNLVRFFTGLALITSGISLFSLERGNLIYLSAICVAFYLIGYSHKKSWVREFSYVSLAIAFALKCYPALFGILLLYEKRYNDAIKVAVYGLALFFLPFLFFNGGFENLWPMIQNLEENSTNYMFRDITYRFGFIPAAMIFNLSKTQIEFVHLFSGILVILSALTAWSHRLRWKKIMLLTCSIILFPVNCGYYCGLYLFVPIILFLNEEHHRSLDWIYIILIIIILNPYQYYINDYLVTVPTANLILIGLYISLSVEAVEFSIRHLINYFSIDN